MAGEALGVKHLVLIALLLTGCETLTPEQREQRAEEHRYKWTEACNSYMIFIEACERAGGFVFIRQHGPGTTRRRAVCPRSIMDMKQAECVSGLYIFDGTRPAGRWP